MPVGIDDAANVMGIVGVTATLFAGCIKGFTILVDAWKFGKDIAILKCLLEAEQHRLYSWADSVGLLGDEGRLPFAARDLLIVRSILESLSVLVGDVETLHRQYKLDLETTDEEIKELATPDTPFGRFMLKTRPNFYQQAAQIFRKRNSPWKRLKWVAVDVDKARTLIKDIASMVDHLEGFLHTTQSQTQTLFFERMMRQMIVMSNDVRTLKAIAEQEQDGLDNGVLAATARCKEDGISLGVLQLVSTGNSNGSTLVAQRNSFSSAEALPRQPQRHLRLDASRLYITAKDQAAPHSRVLAHFGLDPVLVEWKPVNKASNPNIQCRIEGVAAFLSGITHSSFHTLRCRGYFKEPGSSRYGYVFNLPVVSAGCGQHTSASQRCMPRMQSLKDALRNPLERPPLNERIALAIALTETVLQLHTSGFVHKEIRPENILFFSHHGADAISDATSKFVAPYLAGYVYARADNPLEATETPEAQFDADLYRHPSSLGESKVSYSKSFDLFSLGCVLLELAVWSKLSRIFLESSKQEAGMSASVRVLSTKSDLSEHKLILIAKQRLLDLRYAPKLQRIVEACCGRVYASVVIACLHAAVAPAMGEKSDLETTDYALEVQTTSLARLRSICV